MPRRLIDFAALCVASILIAFVIVVLIAATANAQEHHRRYCHYTKALAVSSLDYPNPTLAQWMGEGNHQK